MENKSLRQQKIDLQQLHDQLQSALTSTQAELFKTRQRAEIMSTELIESNKALAHDKWILGQEKVRLFWQLKQWESMATTGWREKNYYSR